MRVCSCDRCDVVTNMFSLQLYVTVFGSFLPEYGCNMCCVMCLVELWRVFFFYVNLCSIVIESLLLYLGCAVPRVHVVISSPKYSFVVCLVLQHD